MSPAEELRQIIGELKRPFPAPLHEIRELPGGAKKWVFLRWQTVRERLDEVVPDWTIDHSEIQYLNNDAICRCGITISGVRKEAIASVPIALLSSKGNDMARGSAADRLAAEAIKNAAEAWGVARYLDDQAFVIKYLWENRLKLDDKFMGELRKLSHQYNLMLRGESAQPLPKETNPGGKLLEAMGDDRGAAFAQRAKEPKRTISEPQQKRFWAIAKGKLKLSDETAKVAQKHFGFDHTEQITTDRYDELIEYLYTLSSPLVPVNSTGEEKNLPWKDWKTPEDAIAWAQSQLPAHPLEFLQQQFAQLPATNGKKAPTWVAWVQELKKLEF